jgi:hypothetical protein
MIGRGAVFLASAAFTSVFFIVFCNAVYGCGCEPIWGAGAKYCNIHAAHGKHCPWCSFGTAGYAGVYGTILAAQAWCAFGPFFGSSGKRLMAGLLAFPAVGAILALVLGLFTGYWH